MVFQTSYDLHRCLDHAQCQLQLLRSYATVDHMCTPALSCTNCSSKGVSTCLSGVQPDTVTYNLALKACEAPANTTLAPELLDTALGLLHGMIEKSVAPDVMTYTTILGLCAQAGDGQAALALYEVSPPVPQDRIGGPPFLHTANAFRINCKLRTGVCQQGYSEQ